MDQNVKLFRTRVKIGNWNQERYLEEVCFKDIWFIWFIILHDLLTGGASVS